ncbi:hypothetical protein B0J12DRAFT_639497 [Macrophomina phaseolina]|uniref:Uncharacterized protein n=1 Tax=Macrophomina phaseolina TaxID=35725 RepID=A0ABQ8GVD0_9PEZI|nr:hypothetical protein B0J12DRAFT_639497 [Macrophomina phaseolina]
MRDLRSLHVSTCLGPLLRQRSSHAFARLLFSASFLGLRCFCASALLLRCTELLAGHQLRVFPRDEGASFAAALQQATAAYMQRRKKLTLTNEMPSREAWETSRGCKKSPFLSPAQSNVFRHKQAAAEGLCHERVRVYTNASDSAGSSPCRASTRRPLMLASSLSLSPCLTSPIICPSL